MPKYNSIKHFNLYEFDDPEYPGSGQLIDRNLVIMLDELRSKTEWPIVTHWLVGGCVDVDGTHGHSKNSYHLKAQGFSAVDFHFKTKTPSRLQYYEVSLMGFGGIGVYFDWMWDNKKLPIGFHVDMRSLARCQRWKRVNDETSYLLL